MAIAEFAERRNRSLVAYHGDQPNGGFVGALELLGYQLVALDRGILKSPDKLANVDSVVFSQRGDKPTAIHHELEEYGPALLNHDCRVYVRVAQRPELAERARIIVVNALNTLRLPAGPLQAGELKLVDSTIKDREGLPFAPFVYICDSALPWEEVARAIVENPAGKSPNLLLKIDAFGADDYERVTLDDETTLLIRRAFHDCSEVHLTRMADGLSGVSAYRAYAVPAKGLLGPWPLLQFVKTGMRGKICREFENYEGNALLYIPFHLGPKLNRNRCGLSSSKGILVGDFVEDAETLSGCASGGRAGPAIANLFNKTLRSWHHTGVPDNKHSLMKLIMDRFPESIPAHREARTQALGATRTLKELRDLLIARDSTPVRVGAIHGDLHATNVLVRGADAIVIDFERLQHGRPLLCDAASLEAGLLVEGFKADKRQTEEWLNSVGDLYSHQTLDDRIEHNPRDSSAWFSAAVRQIRLYARELECVPGQYHTVLAFTLIAKACNAHEFKDRRQDLRAAAYLLAQQILTSKKDK